MIRDFISITIDNVPIEVHYEYDKPFMTYDTYDPESLRILKVYGGQGITSVIRSFGVSKFTQLIEEKVISGI